MSDKSGVIPINDDLSMRLWTEGELQLEADFFIMASRYEGSGYGNPHDCGPYLTRAGFGVHYRVTPDTEECTFWGPFAAHFVIADYVDHGPQFDLRINDDLINAIEDGNLEPGQRLEELLKTKTAKDLTPEEIKRALGIRKTSFVEVYNPNDLSFTEAIKAAMVAYMNLVLEQHPTLLQDSLSIIEAERRKVYDPETSEGQRRLNDKVGVTLYHGPSKSFLQLAAAGNLLSQKS